MIKWLYQRFYKKPYEVSVIVPTYDNVEFLDECILSIINSAEHCCEFEILLGIDNCKKTLEFVSSSRLFKNKNIKIYYFPKNVGPYVVRNSLAAKAKYDNILFFDSDDIMMEKMIQVLFNSFDGKSMVKYKFYNFDSVKKCDLKLSPIFCHGSFLIPKSIFFKLNGFFGWKCGADSEFYERYENKANAVEKLDTPLFYRRYHDKNITRSTITGINSALRNKYGKIIMDNRANEKWNNPKTPQIFKPNLVQV